MPSRISPRCGTNFAALALPVTFFADRVLPLAAHAQALRDTLSDNAAVPLEIWLSLGLWAVVCLTAAARKFRWE